MLKRLWLDGWFSYDKADFCFSQKGVGLIKGNVGAGKSAIIEAIIYLLYGKTLRKKSSVKDFQNKILNSGYHIFLEFSQSGKDYKIEEFRGRGASDGLYLYCLTPDKKDLTSDKSLNTWAKVGELIGLSYDEFSHLCILGQRHTQKLIVGTSGERSSLLTGMFGLERYDSSIRKINEEIKKVSDKQKNLVISLTSLQESLEGAEKSLTPVESPDTEHIEDRIAELRAEKSEIEVQVKAIRKRKEDAVASVRTAKYALQQATELGKAKVEHLEVTQALLKAKERAKLGDEDAQAKVDELAKRLEVVQSKRSKLDGELESVRKDLRKVASLGNTCPITSEECPVNVPVDFKDQREAALVEREEACQEKWNGLDGKETKIKNVLKKVKDCALLERKLTGITRVLKTEAPENLIDIPAKEAEDRELAKKIADKLSTQALIGTEIEELIAEASSGKARVKAYEDLKKFLKEGAGKISALQEEHKEFSVEAKYLAAALSIYKHLKMCKIDSVLEALSEKTNERLDRISGGVYSVEFLSQKESSKGNSMLDALDILISDGHKSIPISMASGGQADYVAIAVLLALHEIAATMSNKSVNVLFLDEVFGPLDENAVARAFEEIVSLAEELDDTIKVISHKKMNESLASEIWEITMENGITTMEIA